MVAMIVEHTERTFREGEPAPRAGELQELLGTQSIPDSGTASDALSRMLLGGPLPSRFATGTDSPEDPRMALTDRAAILAQALERPPRELLCALAITALDERVNEEANRRALRSLLVHDRDVALVAATIGSYSPSEQLILYSLLAMQEVDQVAAEFRAAELAADPLQTDTLRQTAYDFFVRARGDHLTSSPRFLLDNRDPRRVSSLLTENQIYPSPSAISNAATLAVGAFAATEGEKVTRALTTVSLVSATSAEAIASLLLHRDAAPGSEAARAFLVARDNPIVSYIEQAWAARG